MNAMPSLDRPTKAQLFGAGDLRCDVMQLTIHRIDSLADIDRVLLCADLPKTVRRSAEKHRQVLEEIQAAAGDGIRLRALFATEPVVLRSGAMKLTRRLISEAP